MVTGRPGLLFLAGRYPAERPAERRTATDTGGGGECRDVDDRFAFDEIWSEFVTAPYPARAVVQSDLPGFAIELAAIVALPTSD